MIKKFFLVALVIGLQLSSTLLAMQRELEHAVDQAARNYEHRQRELHQSRWELEGDQDTYRQRLATNPNDFEAQRGLARVQQRLDYFQQQEQHLQGLQNQAERLVLDGAQAMFIEPIRSKAKLKEAVATAAVSQKMANQGAMERLNAFMQPQNLIRTGALVGGVGAVLIATYFAAKFGLYYAQRFVGMPKLVRESSDKGLWQNFVSMFASQEDAVDFLQGIVLSPDIMAIISDLAKAAQETKNDGIPFRNVVLYGEPGTGKTMIAKRIARYCGMDYAILSGADFSQFEEGKDIQQLHELFDRAELSSKGMLIFIDEAEAALRDRKHQDNRGKALVDAFLARTGDKSTKFMIVLATNHPQDLDTAVLSRISKKVHVALPDVTERAKIVKLYLDKYFVQQATVLDGEQAMLSPDLDDNALKNIVSSLNGWSGRDLEDLVGELRYVLSSEHSRSVTEDIIKKAADEKIKQRKELLAYDGHTAAHSSLKGDVLTIHAEQ